MAMIDCIINIDQLQELVQCFSRMEMSIYHIAVGCCHQNLESTRGCTTPRLPRIQPCSRMSNCWPGKQKGFWVGTNLQSFSKVRFDFLRIRSRAPWTTEKIPFLLPSSTSSVITAASFLRFLAPVSVELSTTMQSPASKSLQGRGLDLFSQMVRRRPERRVILPVWNSFVLAFSILMSFPSSSLKMFVVTSALEQRAKLSTSLNWACAIQCLRKSVNLLILNLPPMVVEGGIAGTIFVYPQQIAMSQRTSHSWRISPRQKGAQTLYVPSSAIVAVRPVLLRQPTTSSGFNLAPIKVSAFLCCTTNSLGETLGVRNRSSPLMISTGSTWNGTSQYSEKDQMMLLRQMKALGLLRAVTSTRTFLVLMEILECSPLMMGGTEHTTSLASRTRGQTGLSLIRWRYSLSLWFSSNSIMPSPLTFASWFRGMNSNSFGSLATYLKGPWIVSKSWVPIDAYFLALQKVSCSFS